MVVRYDRQEISLEREKEIILFHNFGDFRKQSVSIIITLTKVIHFREES